MIPWKVINAVEKRKKEAAYRGLRVPSVCVVLSSVARIGLIERLVFTNRGGEGMSPMHI